VVEERHVEARVVRDEDCIPGECEEPSRHSGDRRRAPQLLVAQPGQRRNAGLQPRAGVGKCLEALR
jgi:hypothetical protein